MDNTDKRILVLGSDLSTKLVDCFAWDNLPDNLNVADYDVVIVNCVSLLDEKYISRIDRNRLPSRNNFFHLLFSPNSEIILLGFSENKILIEYNWLPLFPNIIKDKIEKINLLSEKFNYYFKFIKSYVYQCEPKELMKNISYSSIISQFNQIIDPNIYRFRPQLNVIAQTRFEKAIAFELKISVVTKEGYEEQDRLKESGNIIWLPPTTEIPQDEGIGLILKNRYCLQLDKIQPSWLSTYKLPQQIPIEEKITRYQEEIKRLESQVKTSEQQLQQETIFLQLLYEQGDALEIVVRDTLTLLGAEVEKGEKGKEDGRFTDTQGRKGMLEIKGKTGTLALKDIRQLDQRVRDAMILENEHYKGVLIINAHCDQPPNQRPDPFPNNCIETAQQTAHQCLMTTSQLFKALCDYQEGKLNIEKFWDTIFNTNGVCKLPDIEL